MKERVNRYKMLDTCFSLRPTTMSMSLLGSNLQWLGYRKWYPATLMVCIREQEMCSIFSLQRDFQTMLFLRDSKSIDGCGKLEPNCNPISLAVSSGGTYE